MRRFFTIAVSALAMAAVALISAFITMRLAIHGREVDVPPLTGLTVADAGRLASHDGLNLTLENRFYSTDFPAGRVLAQSPAPGTRVRRDWTVRITESLGAQRVSIPDLMGQSERAATISLRRLSLEPGVVAHLPAEGDTDVVIAQTPEANSGGVTGPRVSLLVSMPETSEGEDYAMPSLLGLNPSAASARAGALGLRVMNAGEGGGAASPRSGPEAAGIVIAQTPAAGRRVARGDAVHLVFEHPTGARAPGQ